MGPEMMALSTALAAGTTVATQVMSAQASKQQSAAQSQWAERQALEERTAAQRQADEEKRKADLAQGRLMSIAGASGSGASDPTVLNLMEGIEREGEYNARTVQATGDQKAAGITYQSALNRWAADSESKIKKIGAVGTLIGSLGKGYGEYQTGMAKRYGNTGYQSGSTGYGFRSRVY